MMAETQKREPKQYEGFAAPVARPGRAPVSRSWQTAWACLASFCSAAAIFFFFLSALRIRSPLTVPLSRPLPSPLYPNEAVAADGASSDDISPSEDGGPWGAINASRTLKWQPCGGGLDCARLDVPMDWQAPSDDARVVLAVIRRRATGDPADYRGAVFFNPGGPGGSGVYAMRDRGAHLHEIVGTNHDLVTWDPRGVGASLPRVDCWGASPSRARVWALQDPGVIGAHPGVLGAVYARATAYSSMCEQAMNDTQLLQHIGTAAHARDLRELVEQTGGDKKLRYWGFSYGTLLGGTFAALWPDRVARLVSDGNVDYREWYWQRRIGFLQDADRVLGAFFWFCHDAGPDGCAFHAPTREGIRARLDALLEQIRVAPVVVPAVAAASGAGPDMPQLVTWSDVKRLISAALYQPVLLFPRLAEALAALERGDGRPYYALTTGGKDGGDAASRLCDSEAVPSPGTPRGAEDTEDAFPAIMCADLPLINDTVDEFGRFARELEDLSHDAGAVNTLFRMACLGRTVRPKWRYDGPFEANTSFPILFVNNVVDNVTPLASARNNAVGFPGSRILMQNSYGHTSLAAASTCTSTYIKNYFQNGSLPPNGTNCMPDVYPFQDVRPQADDKIAVATHELAKTSRIFGPWPWP